MCFRAEKIRFRHIKLFTYGSAIIHMGLIKSSRPVDIFTRFLFRCHFVPFYLDVECNDESVRLNDTNKLLLPHFLKQKSNFNLSAITFRATTAISFRIWTTTISFSG